MAVSVCSTKIVFMTYGAIVASELWFIYRRHFEVSLAPRKKADKSLAERGSYLLFSLLTLGHTVKVIPITARYLLFFLIFAISLELLDLFFRASP